MRRMASISSETSYWIKFLTDAGIPAGDAAHYAIVFADNRISKDMMLDLSKEYLKDMGITKLGDVIAILKHAQKVYNQEAKDLLLKSSNLSTLRSSSPSVNSPRRSTAASRMVNQITSKHPEASPMSQQPAPRPVSPDLASTKRKVSVFDRLGAEGGDMTVSVPKSSLDAGGNNVFSRLGGKTALKRPASSTSLNELDDNAQSLPYVGVLKNPGSPSPVRKKKKVEVVPAVKMTPLKKQRFQINSIKKTITPSNITVSNIQRPEVSTSTEGVLSAFAKKEAPSLRDRLGSKTELPSSTTMLNMDKAKPRVKMAKARVQNRLGAKKEDQTSSSVVSSTQQINVKLKKAKELSLRSAKQDSGKATGVFSRLGKMSKV